MTLTARPRPLRRRCLRIAVALPLALLLMVGASLPAMAAAYRVDPAQSHVQFQVSFLAFRSVSGTFKTFEASAQIEDGTLTELEATINADSVDTGNDSRDEHLRSDHFFNTEDHPSITFRSTHVVPQGGGNYLVEGTLTLRGIARPVTLKGHVRADAGAEGAFAFEAKGEINRHEWEVSWNQSASGRDLAISDTVHLTLAGRLLPVAA